MIAQKMVVATARLLLLGLTLETAESVLLLLGEHALLLLLLLNIVLLFLLLL